MNVSEGLGVLAGGASLLIATTASNKVSELEEQIAELRELLNRYIEVTDKKIATINNKIENVKTASAENTPVTQTNTSKRRGRMGFLVESSTLT